MNQTVNQRKNQITLIEIIIFAAVLLIIIALALSFISKVREDNNRNRCISNLRPLSMAMKAYGADNLATSYLPYDPDFKTSNDYFSHLAKHYLRDADGEIS